MYKVPIIFSAILLSLFFIIFNCGNKSPINDKDKEDFKSVIGPYSIGYKIELPENHVLISTSIDRGDLTYTTQDTISKDYHMYSELIGREFSLKAIFKSNKN